jgi:hypothetical protein
MQRKDSGCGGGGCQSKHSLILKFDKGSSSVEVKQVAICAHISWRAVEGGHGGTWRTMH